VSAGALITIVGIGADGWPGLTEKARAAILCADEVIGSDRQLASLPRAAPPRRAWPSPITPLIDELVTREVGAICVLASGDPMLHGIGATLARRLPRGRLTVISHASALALACARMGWPEAEVELISAVGRPPDVVARMLQPGRHLVVYSTGENAPAETARVLCDRGYGPSAFVVMEQLGADSESVIESTADTFGDHAVDPLHAIAITCARAATTTLLPVVPGLPDQAYAHDGALTKRHVRAATLAALAPTPDALLWDIGAGSGSIAIEWLRAEATARAIAIEARAERAARITRNAVQLGVPALEVILGTAPDVLAGLDRPDAVFIGGGVTTAGVVATSWAALRTGGRIVANAVTLEGEQGLIAARAAYGGDLVRLDVSHAEPIGSFTAWRPALPVVQWSTEKR
jgi:precorrin-6B C5,15-methyltransferase / cobalt-precorrin-6B C5,C15-methyltransferase